MTERSTMDHQEVEVAMGRLLSDFASTASAVLVTVGLRTGLWEALAAGPGTADDIAGRAGVAPPYSREWLRALTAAGYLTFDPRTAKFDLAAGFGALMAGPLRGMTSGTCEQLAVWWGLTDRYEEAYRTGEGISWAELPPVHAEAMDHISRTVVVPQLIESWLPAIKGITARLIVGGRVADVGCGYGAASIALARAFPSSQFVGIDLDDASVSRARSAAIDAGVSDRVSFEVSPAADLGGGPYDLIVFADSLHDFGRPREALTRASEVLAEDGVVLLVEHAGSDRLEENLNPLGQFFYACSALVCTPNALADRPDGHPLGSMPGERTLGDLAAAAGFGRIARLDVQAPMHVLLELRH